MKESREFVHIHMLKEKQSGLFAMKELVTIMGLGIVMVGRVAMTGLVIAIIKLVVMMGLGIAMTGLFAPVDLRVIMTRRKDVFMGLVTMYDCHEGTGGLMGLIEIMGPVASMGLIAR
jgi:hypothetical protein